MIIHGCVIYNGLGWLWAYYYTVHYAESGTFASLEIRQPCDFFRLFRNNNSTRNIHYMKDNDMKFQKYFFKFFFRI